ncbi:MAG: FecR family protein [Bacteroidetes bacterium]|nr:FecR family protein [Bacteroidota bacterium]
MKDLNNDIELITRVLTGEASVEEKECLLSWIEESKSNKKLFFEMKDIWDVSQASLDDRFNSTQSWERFRNQIELNEEEEQEENRNHILISFLRIAAIVIVSVGLSWLVFNLMPPKAQLSARNEVITPKGSKTQIVLPDGTKVWLNAESKLTYYSDYNGEKRDVLLSGEGFFEVVKNPNKPFIVKTGKIDIKAFGTAFNVKSYPSDGFVETTLINGVVTIERVSTKKTLAILKPNQKSIFYKDDIRPNLTNILKLNKQKISKDSIIEVNALENILLAQTNTELQTAWKEQKLYFTSETFDEIAIKLERWYGVTIHLQSDDLMNERFTGKFTHNEPLVQVLEAIKITTPITYTIKLNDIYINLKK